MSLSRDVRRPDATKSLFSLKWVVGVGLLAGAIGFSTAVATVERALPEERIPETVEAALNGNGAAAKHLAGHFSILEKTRK